MSEENLKTINIGSSQFCGQNFVKFLQVFNSQLTLSILQNIGSKILTPVILLDL